MSQLDEQTLRRGLQSVLGRQLAGLQSIEELQRLSGGASQETWSFDAQTAEGRRPLVLRRSATDTKSATSLGKRDEAALQQAAAEAGVPVASVRAILGPEDGLGSGYVMERLEGETIARRILRDDAFEQARQRMAFQCGEILARIHAMGVPEGTDLRRFTGPDQIRTYRELYDRFDDPHPVFEVAFRRLEERIPEPRETTVVHGDFRNGNFIVGPDGIRAVLDWELAHLGDPMEDLGWICVNSWRFGELEKPVGGFGERQDLFAGYAAGGGRVDEDRVLAWEAFGTLKWGIMCMIQGFAHLAGQTRSVEKAAIGRRASETEIDLLELLP